MPFPHRSDLHSWATLKTELVWIYDQPVGPTSQHGKNFRAQGYWAWLLRQGTLRVQAEGKVWKISPGTWFFPPLGSATHQFSKDAHLLSVRFLCQRPSSEGILQNLPRQLHARSCPGLERHAVRLERLVRRFLPEKNLVKVHSTREVDFHVFLRFQTAFYKWLDTWVEAMVSNGAHWSDSPARDWRIERMIQFLDTVSFEKEFPRKELRRETGLSDVHLNRLCLLELGQTSRKYWDHRRIAFCRVHLEGTVMSIKEIAYRCGFRNNSHFAVWFKRHSGMSPSSYREQTQRI